jgi:hypothetical protein
MHIALRAPKEKNFTVDGVNVVPDVHAVLEKVGNDDIVSPADAVCN